MFVYSCSCRAREGILLQEIPQCPGGTDGNIISQKEEPPEHIPGALLFGLSTARRYFFFPCFGGGPCLGGGAFGLSFPGPFGGGP